MPAVKSEKKPAAKAVNTSSTDRNWLEIFSIFIHDLESPLVSMKYLLRLLAEGKYDSSNARHQRIVDSSKISMERAESIIYDIMAVARSGDAGLPVQITNLVPTEIINEAICLISASADENSIAISFTNNSGDCAVKADPQLLKRMLDNLLYNAIRHTPTGGTISVYTEPGQKCLFIHVKDSGPGLGDIDPSKLFEKYGQLDLRSDQRHRGVGLGLYFCRLAAIGMGGTIIAGDHPKGGAVMTIKLMKITE